MKRLKLSLIIFTVILSIALLAGCGSTATTYPAHVEGALFGGASDDSIAVDVTFDSKWITKNDNTKYKANDIVKRNSKEIIDENKVLPSQHAINYNQHSDGKIIDNDENEFANYGNLHGSDNADNTNIPHTSATTPQNYITIYYKYDNQCY